MNDQNSYAYIGSISGDFVGNCIEKGALYAYGGAICSKAGSDATAEIGSITGADDEKGQLTDNYIVHGYTETNDTSKGGAIANNATNGRAKIGNINADFNYNYIDSSEAGAGNAIGGAISNDMTQSGLGVSIGGITCDFTGNYIKGTADAWGGAIFNRANSTVTGTTASIGITYDENGNA
ncbi:MAG: hypothetical protein LUD41_07770 [Phascolarctobacterium sp.]|nr:hypothetical protein [Phascolarctobacterium sp.]